MAALFLGLVLLIPAGHAAPVNLAVTFTATGFKTGPATISGSFNAKFDTAQIYLSDPNVVTNFKIDNHVINVPNSILFSYIPLLGATIGGPTLASLVTKGTDDFRLALTLLGNSFTYSQQGVIRRYNTFDVTFSAVQVSATPIPGSVLMLLTALGSLGGAAFFRGRKARSAIVAA